MNTAEKKFFIEWLENLNSANNTLIQRLKSEEMDIATEKEKYKVSEFAKIIGCTQKTVYALIRRNEVRTISERIRGRKISFILAANNEIQKIKRNYI